MKIIFELTALAAAFTLFISAATATKSSDRVMVQFCKDSTLKDCVGPYSIFSEDLDFSIPEGYTYVASVPVPLNVPTYTLSAYDSSTGDIVACEVFLTGAESPIHNKAEQPAGGLYYQLFPGSLGKSCANGKCVKCTDSNI
jgi:hypothetical protein